MPTPFNASLTSGSGLIPGANFGGGSMAVPGASDSARVTDTLGSNGSNPLLPQFPGGTQTPPMRDSINLAGLDPAAGNRPLVPNDQTKSSGAGGGSDAGIGAAAGAPFGGVGAGIGALIGSLFGNGGPKNPGQLNDQGQWVPNQKDFIKAMKKSGFSAGVAGMLFNFIQSGAGFNPQAVQMLIDAQQPGIQRKEADIMEWFGSKGLGNTGSAPAIAMGDFLANTQVQEGQIWAGMYEQSVQNYMNVLMGGKGQPAPSTFQNILSWIQTSSQAALDGAKAAAA